uniref:Cytochrome c biogenesis protein CcsA n=1 Tax=Pseudomuriella schumacherensis TaxID=889459 RepID=A0A140HB76_PSESB|nr:heme attachment to plastid cytochrome c [Pseudomuriella schumacherensis]AMO01425.1 heme attachment to plastid cytochrome c [Pseudomuriella schumacherensis]
MTFTQVENFLSNFSFLILLISVVYYWVQTAFFSLPKNVGTFGMICANVSLFSLLVLRWIESGHFPLSNLYESLMFLSWSFTVLHLFLELMTQTNFLNTSFYLNSQEKENSKMKIFAIFNTRKFKFSLKSNSSLFGALTSPSALFTNAFATFSLPAEMQHSSALVPALQSNWLMMHVTVMILSYAALISGSLLSIAFLVLTREFSDEQLSNVVSFDSTINKSTEFVTKNPIQDNQQIAFNINTLNSSLSLTNNNMNMSDFLPTPNSSEPVRLTSSLDANTQQNTVKSPEMSSVWKGSSLVTDSKNLFSRFQQNKLKYAQNLENLSYRILGIGFPLLTIGILSGAVWANEAWGSYWSWDPKETWALLTWLVFAIYLHTRLTKGWQGKKPAIIASLGFLSVWICFLGVNLLGEGLHSYGFVQVAQ